MKEKKVHKTFKDGPIDPNFIADSIAKHSSKTGIGAHSIFLGQVRDDMIEDRKVQAIDYSCYEEMAEEKFHEIRESAFQKFDLTCMHIYHSIGLVNTGGISLFVFTSSKHRKNAIKACEWIVEEIKAKVPIWGKEILNDQSISWKINDKNK